MSGIVIREMETLAEFREGVRLQKEIWGFEDVELLPLRLFVVASKIGGQVFGAFDGERMVGFLLAIPGLKRGETTYLHSHMMGVLQEYRNQGLGRRMKLAQREEALERGMRLVEWTFDPLEIKNAYLQHREAGGGGAALRAEPVRDDDLAPARRTADGPLRGGVAPGSPEGAHTDGEGVAEST